MCCAMLCCAGGALLTIRGALCSCLPADVLGCIMLSCCAVLCRGRPADVYALGGCLYAFVLGRIPFK